MLIISYSKDTEEVLNRVHSEPLDHCAIPLAVCDNDTFFSGFGCGPIRGLFDRRFCSMNSSIRRQQKG